jgi:protein ImuA
MSHISKAGILKSLQADIIRLQGFKSTGNAALDIGLGEIRDAFPNKTFPIGAVHEFLSECKENTTSTIGFIAGLLLPLMKNNGAVLWISSTRTLFPPALKSFGIEPDRFVFVNLQKERDMIWAMDEALKCNALSAVIGEIREIDFTSSRRLQLAVEQSHVTGFIVRSNYRKLNTTACVSRWKITSLPGEAEDDLPGIGFPKWKVELLRMRNGKTGSWNLQWINRRFLPTLELQASLSSSELLQANLPLHHHNYIQEAQRKKAG